MVIMVVCACQERRGSGEGERGGGAGRGSGEGESWGRVSILCTENLFFPHIVDWPAPTGHPPYDKYDPLSTQVNPSAPPSSKEIGKQLPNYIQTS